MSLHEILETVTTEISDEIITNDTKIRFNSLITKLPSIYWAGFEVNLNDDKRVDFHQGIRADKNNLSKVKSYIQENTLLTPDCSNKINMFLEFWEEDIEFSNNIPYIVFEFDLYENTDEYIPSIFISFREELTNKQRYLLGNKILKIFKIPTTTLDNFELFFKSCKQYEHIRHIGIMLSRNQSVIRINIKNLQYNRIKTFLDSVKYNYPIDPIEELFNKYMRFSSQSLFCFDVGEYIHNKIGIEFSIREASSSLSSYRNLLAELNRNSLCNLEKINPLIKWIGRDTIYTKSESWSKDLLIESLIRPNNHFSIIERTINHIKIDYIPNQKLKAKAYLGFEHIWLEKKLNISSNTNNPNDISVINQAIERGIEYLLKNRNQAGWWKDYNNYSFAGSDEWITAYIAYILCCLDIKNDEISEVINQSCKLLKACQRENGGWGWSYFTAPDADSTLWVLSLLNKVIKDNSIIKDKALDFVKSHERDNFGIGTYNLNNFKYANPEEIKGWLPSQKCVTSVLSNIDELSNYNLDFLLDSQNNEGYWDSIWWKGSEFSTYLVVKAISKYKNDKVYKSINKAAKWSEGKINNAGSVYSEFSSYESPFATANCLNIILYSKNIGLFKDIIHNSLNWILNNQKENGSWMASAVMYHPEKLSSDDKSFHTTATIINVLNNYKKLLLSEEI